jgi:hypothetical protein
MKWPKYFRTSFGSQCIQCNSISIKKKLKIWNEDSWKGKESTGGMFDNSYFDNSKSDKTDYVW